MMDEQKTVEKNKSQANAATLERESAEIFGGVFFSGYFYCFSLY